MFEVDNNTNGVAAGGQTVHQLNAAHKQRWEELKQEAAAHHADGSTVRASRCERAMRRIEEDVLKLNRGLTVGRARRFAVDRAVSDSDDYIAVAAAALWQAFIEWNPSKGTLSTFAVPYIDGSVRRSVAAIEAPEISYGDWTAGPKVRAEAARIEHRTGRKATAEEIASTLSLTVTLVERVLMQRPTSLDAPVGDGESKRGDLVGDESDDVHDTAFADAEDPFEIIERASGALNDRELFVIARRFGLDAGRTQSLNEIAQTIGTSREAVRRAETSAKPKLERALG